MSSPVQTNDSAKVKKKKVIYKFLAKKKVFFCNEHKIPLPLALRQSSQDTSPLLLIPSFLIIILHILRHTVILYCCCIYAWGFGASLKKEYDPKGRDRLTERVVLMVEAGQI